MVWTRQTTEEFSHWYDPDRALDWIARLRALLGQETAASTLPWATQRAHVVSVWQAIGNIYRAFNVSPHGDYAYRELFADLWGAPPVLYPVRPYFLTTSAPEPPETDLVWRATTLGTDETMRDPSPAPSYVNDAVAMFRRVVDPAWRGNAQVVVRAGILQETGVPLFGCLAPPPGDGERCAFENQWWPPTPAYNWDSIAVGGRGVFDNYLRIQPPLRWSMGAARRLSERFQMPVEQIHRELVLSTLVENVRTARRYQTNYSGLAELATLGSAARDDARRGFGTMFAGAVGRAGAALSLVNPLVGGIVAGAGELLGRILEALGVPMAVGWFPDLFAFAAPRLIPAVVSMDRTSDNRPRHTVPAPEIFLPLNPVGGVRSLWNVAPGTPGAPVTLTTLPSVEPGHEGDRLIPTVQPTPEAPGISTGTKIAAGGLGAAALVWFLSRR